MGRGASFRRLPLVKAAFLRCNAGSGRTARGKHSKTPEKNPSPLTRHTRSAACTGTPAVLVEAHVRLRLWPRQDLADLPPRVMKLPGQCFDAHAVHEVGPANARVFVHRDHPPHPCSWSWCTSLQEAGRGGPLSTRIFTDRGVRIGRGLPRARRPAAATISSTLRQAAANRFCRSRRWLRWRAIESPENNLRLGRSSSFFARWPRSPPQSCAATTANQRSQ
jgi:hypothetical protein